MISVTFDVKKGQCEKELLAFFTKCNMPWLSYLTANATMIEPVVKETPHRDLDAITYKFYLRKQQETFYRLKYSSN